MATWIFLCKRCGWSTPTAPFDIQGTPGPDRCAAVYNNPPYPADAGHPTAMVSGPCNGEITRHMVE